MYHYTMSYYRVYWQHVYGDSTYMDIGFIFSSMSRITLTFNESYMSRITLTFNESYMSPNVLFTSISNLFSLITGNTQSAYDIRARSVQLNFRCSYMENTPKIVTASFQWPFHVTHFVLVTYLYDILILVTHRMPCVTKMRGHKECWIVTTLGQH